MFIFSFCLFKSVSHTVNQIITIPSKRAIYFSLQSKHVNFSSGITTPYPLAQHNHPHISARCDWIVFCRHIVRNFAQIHWTSNSGESFQHSLRIPLNSTLCIQPFFSSSSSFSSVLCRKCDSLCIFWEWRKIQTFV